MNWIYLRKGERWLCISLTLQMKTFLYWESKFSMEIQMACRSELPVMNVINIRSRPWKTSMKWGKRPWMTLNLISRYYFASNFNRTLMACACFQEAKDCFANLPVFLFILCRTTVSLLITATADLSIKLFGSIRVSNFSFIVHFKIL